MSLRATAVLVLLAVLLTAASCGPTGPGPHGPTAARPGATASAHTRSEALALYGAGQLKLAQGEKAKALEMVRAAVQADPHSAFLRLELARLLMAEKAEDKAQKQVLEAVRLDPEGVDGWLLLGAINATRKDLTSAIKAYKRVLRLKPDQDEARLFLAMALQEDDRLEEARQVLLELVRRQPQLPLAYFYLARVQVAMKRYPQAEETLLRVLKLSPNSQSAMFALGALYEEESKFDKAEAVYGRILKKSPFSAQAHDRLGRLYLRTGRRQQALRQFALLKGGLALDNPEVLIRTGLVFFELEKYPQAVTEFKQVLSRDSQNQKARFYLGLALQEAKQSQEALKTLAAIPPGDKLYPDASLHQADILQRRGDKKQAEDLLKKALVHLPKEVDLLLALAALRESSDDLDGAIKFIERALKLEPENAESYFRLGVVLDKKGQREKGLKAMRQAIDLDENHARALNYLGYTLAEQGKDLDEAERLIRRALAVRPEAGYILDSLGWVYFQRGDYPRCRDYLLRAAASGEKDPVISEHLGDVSMKLGQYGQAAMYYQQALERKHDKPEQIENKLKQAQGQSGRP